MSDYFLGEIRMFSFTWAPATWALCNGATLPIQQNQALASLLGKTFGGDGVQTIGLPDLRGRAMLGQGASTSGSGVYMSGNKGGAEAVTLTAAQTPAHTHAVQGCTSLGANNANSTPAIKAHFLATTLDKLPPSTDHPIYAAPGTAQLQAINPATVGPAGGGQAHNNMQPFAVTNFCICTSGLYPSRS